ncbi:helix-turn-helix domain-containing protein [Pedobacter lithocola]|uniref:Helix-turn-helix domain-containing protein n=1 Tax=Pedobacter lithocola TaxID=1908239 RepID=A0ABV8PEG8_9SPHI
MEKFNRVDTVDLKELITKIENIEGMVSILLTESYNRKKPYLSTNEVMDMMDVSYAWLKINKHQIGSKVAGKLKFLRKDVEEYIEQDYFKIPKTKR